MPCKALIAKGLITEAEFKTQLSTERANYLAVLSGCTERCGRFSAGFNYRVLKNLRILYGDLSFGSRYNVSSSQAVPVISVTETVTKRRS